jgi:hypothetical protein
MSKSYTGPGQKLATFALEVTKFWTHPTKANRSLPFYESIKCINRPSNAEGNPNADPCSCSDPRFIALWQNLHLESMAPISLASPELGDWGKGALLAQPKMESGMPLRHPRLHRFRTR